MTFMGNQFYLGPGDTVEKQRQCRKFNHLFIEVTTLTLCRDSTFTLLTCRRMSPKGFEAAAFDILYITHLLLQSSLSNSAHMFSTLQGSSEV